MINKAVELKELSELIKRLEQKEAMIAEIISFAYMAKCGVDGINISKSTECSMDGTVRKVLRVEVSE